MPSRHVLRLAAVIAIVVGGVAVLVPATERLHGVFRSAPTPRTAAPLGRRGGRYRAERSAGRGDGAARAGVHQRSGGRHSPDQPGTSLDRTVAKVEHALVRLALVILSLVILSLVILAIVGVGSLWVLLTGARWLRHRRRRNYRLSIHDEAKP
jgi:hypothetical protein